MVRTAVVVAVSVSLGAALAGCAISAAAPGASNAQQKTISVVASTNVWRSIAKEIGGDHVSVVSFIDDPNKDPHEFSVSPRNQLELSRADVVIENGGGYDDFMDTMLASGNNSTATLLNAVELTGHAADVNLNEHVWYDLNGVIGVGQQLSKTFSTIEPEHSNDFEANEQLFEGTLHSLVTKEAYIRALHSGVGVAITEPVPVYMLVALGLHDDTPAAFSKAIEDGTDATPSALEATIDLFDSKRVKLLAYNEQTTGAETEAILASARKNFIPVVPFRETLPAGEDYVAWMTDNLTRIGEALAK